jgi:hypothetical protein
MLFWLGALVSGFLGFRLFEWWVPTAVACAVVALQAVAFRSLLGPDGSGLELLAFSLVVNLVMFHATFAIGRTLGQRLAQRRKGQGSGFRF